ncbi:hypothetical protein JL720_13720 [Aureococcus anophagefferens]|nr:hypothetical protein JL720_13720 [Aureococcus anophagefferens]
MVEAKLPSRWPVRERRFLRRCRDEFGTSSPRADADAYGDRRLLRVFRMDPERDEDKAVAKCSDAYYDKMGNAVTCYQAFHWPAADLKRHLCGLGTAQLAEFVTLAAEYNASQMEKISLAREAVVLADAKRRFDERRKNGEDAKVGRKVKRRVGETDASFQTRQLSIGEQSIARQKKDGAKTSKRGLTCEEHLGQLGHHNSKAAAEGLADICAAHADEAWRLFGPLLDGAARLLGDAHRPCRRHAAAPAPGGPRAAVATPGNARWTTRRRRRGARRCGPRRRLAARLGAALSSFDGGCR